MTGPMSYHFGDVDTHGLTLIAQAGNLEQVHQQIVSDVNSAADFWGGVGNSAHNDFIDNLNRNFQTIYDTLNTHGTKVRQAGNHMGDTDASVGSSWGHGGGTASA
jgi:uncharacterized protein YukE